MINIPKGTKDVLPKDSYKWQFIERTAKEVASIFNVKEIRTPTFEHTEVFSRGIGQTTDVVNKEMYTFLDKGDRSITLKPEGTAGVARAFVENGMNSMAMPIKLFYLTPCFRYERPQAGRLREFHQFGVEVLGSASPNTDAEVIILAQTFLSKCGVKDLELNINSIGCKTCREKYHTALKEFLSDNYNNLCPLCQDRFDKNPLRILDCKNPECQKLLKSAPKMIDYLCEECEAHFENVKELLTSAGVEYSVNPYIVRGLDYYTKTVFEFVSNSVGAQGTICGGGRYDKLISEFGGGDVNGIGFAVGIERLLLLLENTNVEITNENKVKLFFACFGEAESKIAFKLANELRQKGITCEIDHMNRGIKAQFKYADKIGAEYVGVIGSNELERGVVKLKFMATGEEKEVAFKDILKFFTV